MWNMQEDIPFHDFVLLLAEVYVEPNVALRSSDDMALTLAQSMSP